MQKISTLILLISTYFQVTLGYTQVIKVNDQVGTTELMDLFFSHKTCGSFFNVVVTNGTADAIKSIGSFTNNGSSFPFNDGIILSTGSVKNAVGPNDENDLSEGTIHWLGDTDLMNALGVSNTYNATILAFDFIPYTNQISFDYLFSSEQYLANPTSNQCNYTDGFAFLIKKKGTQNYTNLALIPNTNIPVTVQTVRGATSVCPASNEIYFDAYNGYNSPTTYNGQTKILTAKTTVVAGETYHIKLVIADQGNPKYDSAIFLKGSSFENTIDIGKNRTEKTNNPFCYGEKVILDVSKYNMNATFKWYKNGVFTGNTNDKYEITDNKNPNIVTYTVEITTNGTCVTKGTIEAQFSQIPYVSPQTLSTCDFDNDGKGTFNLTKLIPKLNNNTSLKVVFIDALNGTEITSLKTYTTNEKTIYARVYNAYNCYSETTVNLQLSKVPTSLITYEKCEQDNVIDGITQFDLLNEVTPILLNNSTLKPEVTYHSTAIEAEKAINAISSPFTNNVKDHQTLFARIENNGMCYTITPIELIVNYINEKDIQDELLHICKNNILNLAAPDGYMNYLWNNGNTNSFNAISASGTYFVELITDKQCRAVKKYIVKDSKPASFIDVKITEFSDDNNIIEIIYPKDEGSYEFSIDGIHFQDSCVFTNLPANEYLATIRDKNGCGPNVSKLVYVLDYPKFFTPNHDGYNDFWEIKNSLNKNNIASIEIFDRYGKLLKYLTPNQSWDGNYLNLPMPADDYWINITLLNGISIKRNISLKR